MQSPGFASVPERLDALERGVSELRAEVGRAPNDATGEPGSGMARVLAEVAQSSGAHQRKMIGAATLGAGGVVGAIEGLLALFRSFG